MVQDKPSAHVAQIVNAVNAEAERSGAVVLTEGIETPEHLAIALSLGATLGQGWLLGRPEPLPDRLPAAPATPILVSHRSEVSAAASPFELVAAHRQVRQASKSLLIEVSKHLERQALVSSESAVVLAAFQDVGYLTAATRHRYRELAASAAFVGALGAGMPDHPVTESAARSSEPVTSSWGNGTSRSSGPTSQRVWWLVTSVTRAPREPGASSTCSLMTACLRFRLPAR